jgi:hypothetical protein
MSREMVDVSIGAVGAEGGWPYHGGRLQLYANEAHPTLGW